MQLLDVDEGTGQLKVGVKILLVTPTLKSGGQLTPCPPRIAAYELTTGVRSLNSGWNRRKSQLADESQVQQTCLGTYC
jgi:hypothetical protein